MPFKNKEDLLLTLQHCMRSDMSEQAIDSVLDDVKAYIEARVAKKPSNKGHWSGLNGEAACDLLDDAIDAEYLD